MAIDELDKCSVDELLKQLDRLYDAEDELKQKIALLEQYIVYKFGKIRRDNNRTR